MPPQNMLSIATNAASALRHLAGSSDALAFTANQIERIADALSTATRSAEMTARAAEVQAVVSLHGAGNHSASTCDECDAPMYLWESFCKTCGRGAPVLPGKKDAPIESGSYGTL